MTQFQTPKTSRHWTIPEEPTVEVVVSKLKLEILPVVPVKY